jgi:O-antigen/teichoic acid export membrane protein
LEHKTDFIQERFTSVAKNTAFIILGHILQSLVGIITVGYLARYLGAKDFGRYSLVFAYLEFFKIIADLGINTILAREISANTSRASVLIGNGIIIKLLLSCLAILISYLVLLPLSSLGEIKAFIVIAGLSFLFSFSLIYRVVFQVNQKMLYPALISILDSLIKLALFSWIISQKWGLSQFVLGSVICFLPGMILLIYLSHRIIRPEFKLDFKLWKFIFKESWPLAFSAFLVMIYFRIDQLMLFYIKGKEAAGYYSAAVHLAEVFNIIIAALLVPIFPFLSQYFKEQKEYFSDICQAAFKYSFVLIVPAAFGMSILSGRIIPLIYGRQFLLSSLILSILIWSEIFVFFGTVQSNILIAANKQRTNIVFTAVAAVINLILNFILIPRYGAIGASWATVISYASVAISSLFLRSSRIYALSGWLSLVRPFVAASIMAPFVYATKDNLFISIVLGALVFFTSLFIIGGIHKQDIQAIKKYYGNRISKL